MNAWCQVDGTLGQSESVYDIRYINLKFHLRLSYRRNVSYNWYIEENAKWRQYWWFCWQVSSWKLNVQCWKTHFSGVDILKNDVNAILLDIANFTSIEISQRNSKISVKVTSLRTGEKKRPGRNLAIYTGVVIAVLIMSYNLTKDILFIFMCNKAWKFRFFKSISLRQLI